MPEYIEDWRLRHWAAAILAAVFIVVCIATFVIAMWVVFG